MISNHSNSIAPPMAESRSPQSNVMQNQIQDNPIEKAARKLTDPDPVDDQEKNKHLEVLSVDDQPNSGPSLDQPLFSAAIKEVSNVSESVRIESSFRGYKAAPFTRQSIGPESKLEALLALDTLDASRDRDLRALVFKFSEGLPEHLRGKVWTRLLDVDYDNEEGIGLLQFIQTGNLDEANQRVIRSDVERTRAHIPLFRTEEARLTMEQLLTFFCKTKKMKYKQGLNEVLEYHGVSPELYVTPWFLTLFASKSQINHLLCLWDFYIAEGDRFFFCFIALALIFQYRDALFLTDVSQLPETLTQIGIRSYSELRKVWKCAQLLKQNTPVSFATRLSTTQSNKSPISQILQQLEIDEAFYILPQEILRHCYGLHSPRPNQSQRRWKLLVFDIRPRKQFEAGRLPPAVNLDMNEPDWKNRIVALTKSACVAPICGSTVVTAAPGYGPQSSGVSRDTELIGQGFEALRDEKNISIAASNGLRFDDQQPEDPSYHICVMAGDASEQQGQLASYVFNMLARELLLRWVSIARGGFRESHQLALQSGLELIDHQPLLCSGCSTTDVTVSSSIKSKRGSAAFFSGFSSRWSPLSISPNFSSADVLISSNPCGPQSSHLSSSDTLNLSPDKPLSYDSRLLSVGSSADRTRRARSLSQEAARYEEGSSPGMSSLTSTFSLKGAFKLVRGRKSDKEVYQSEQSSKTSNLTSSMTHYPEVVSSSKFPNSSNLTSPASSPAPGFQLIIPDTDDSTLTLSKSNYLSTKRLHKTQSEPVPISNERERARSCPPTETPQTEGVQSQSGTPVGLQLKPYFLSSSSPPGRINPVLPSHWTIFRKRFQRLLWSDVTSRDDAYAFPCYIESLKVDEMLGNALLAVSTGEAKLSQHNSSSLQLDVPSIQSPTNLLADATSSRCMSFETTSNDSISPQLLCPETSTVKGTNSLEPIMYSPSDFSFFVPDTRLCQLLVVNHEVAVISSPYIPTSSVKPENNQLLTTFGPSSPKEGSTVALVYTRYRLSDIVRITSKKDLPTVLNFYFSSQKGTPEVALRFGDESTAVKCVSNIRGLYQRFRDKLKPS